MHRDIGLRRCPEKMSSLGGPTLKKNNRNGNKVLKATALIEKNYYSYKSNLIISMLPSFEWGSSW